MGFDAGHIRPLAVAVMRRGDKVLAMKCFDYKKNEIFYRLIGGGIEFGERAADTVVREWQEELGIGIKVTKCLGVDESIFIYEGRQGHEIVFFFEAEPVNPAVCEGTFKFNEDGLQDTEVVWADINGKEPIYPEGYRKFI